MTGKTVLTTGGIGRAAASGLASMGTRVGITGRDRAEQAADGLERTFALDHLAPSLLTSLLPERLVASAPARVVTVSSGAQAMGKIDFDDPMGERKYSGPRAYDQSKLANVMFIYELARRLEGTGVTATVLHPGVTSTAFGAEDPARGRSAPISSASQSPRGPDRQTSGASPPNRPTAAPPPPTPGLRRRGRPPRSRAGRRGRHPGRLRGPLPPVRPRRARLAPPGWRHL